jgi:hypothetical protein
MQKKDLPWYAPSLEAFKETLNWSALIVCTLFSLMTGKLFPLEVAGAAEVIYLLSAPAIPFFRKQAEATQNQAEEQAFDAERAAWMGRLNAASLQKAQNLEKIRQEILRLNALEISKGQGGLLQEDLQKINSLFLSYLRLLFLKNQYEAHLAQENPETVQKELDKLLEEKKLENAPEEMLEKNIEILKKRLEHLQDMQGLLKKADLHLKEIENSFKLVAEQTAGMKGTIDISENLKPLLADAEAIEEVAKQVNPILQQIQH